MLVDSFLDLSNYACAQMMHNFASIIFAVEVRSANIMRREIWRYTVCTWLDSSAHDSEVASGYDGLAEEEGQGSCPTSTGDSPCEPSL